MDRIDIDTTQNVSIQYKVATTPERIGASMLDIIIMLAYFGILNIFINFSHLFSRHPIEESETAEAFLYLFLLPIMFYSLFFETFFNGQSIGKMAVKIKVMRTDGSPPKFGNYLTRWLFRLIDVDMFYGLIAIITLAINGKGQRLGDIAAGTFVIKMKTKEEMESDIVLKVEDAYVPTFPQSEKLTANEADLIKKVLLLNEENSHEMEEKLATKLKEYLGIVTEMGNVNFLRALLQDFNKMNGRK